MKIAIITDIHLGVRNDNSVFLDAQEKFFKQVFFPKIDDLNIKTVVNLGDTFDRRKYVNMNTLKRSKTMFFDELGRRGGVSPTLIGNHDSFFKNTITTNSVDLLVKEYHYKNLQIIDKPTIYNFDKEKVLMMPWICQDNQQECMDAITNSDLDLCMGHFPINGFIINAGHIAEGEIERNVFDKFDMVLSGHFHHRSSDGRIYYLGNPCEYTWQDYGETKGFHIFDFETRKLTFIPNPYKTFYRIIYDDTQYTYEPKDMSQYTNTYVKIVIQKKTNDTLFETFYTNLESYHPFDIKIVEDYSDIIEVADTLVFDQAESTVSLMEKYIDNIGLGNLDPKRLKETLFDVYTETENGEKT